MPITSVPSAFLCCVASVDRCYDTQSFVEDFWIFHLTGPPCSIFFWLDCSIRWTHPKRKQYVNELTAMRFIVLSVVPATEKLDQEILG